MQLDGRRVTIMGLGHFGGGAAAALWVARHRAVVTVTDLADRTTLAATLAILENVPIAAIHLGGHQEEDFRNAELVVVNPAVRPDNPLLQIARDCGARLTSEVELFLRACRGRIIGITGSNGKSTTAAMTTGILQADGRRTWLGGNIGGSLLDDLQRIGPDEYVVLELSSFQLRHLAADVPMPHMAVVTNCSPNHLDWHGNYRHYVAAKQRILTGQSPNDLAVLGGDLGQNDSWTRRIKGRRLPIVKDAEIPALQLPGEHNRYNAACAATAAAAVGCSGEAIRRGLESFGGLPGRLQRLDPVGQRTFYNDTASTTPDSTIAALTALSGPIWLLAGGSDKGLSVEFLAEVIVVTTCGAGFYGATRDKLQAGVAARAPTFPSTALDTMDDAFNWCWSRSRADQNILLSPGCASRDQFQNFRQRGKRFTELVEALRRRNR